MIDYAETEVGDILKVVPPGAPGYHTIGELVRVTEAENNGIHAENQKGIVVNYVFNCGAARVEPTEWKKDFPDNG